MSVSDTAGVKVLGDATPLRGSFVTDSLVEDLRKQITTGVLKAGDPVMPVRALSKTYKISYNSVRRALGQLSREGFISLERGRGTFVKPLPGHLAGATAQVAVQSAEKKPPAPSLQAIPNRLSIGLLFHAGAGVLHGATCYREALRAVEYLVLINGDMLTIVTGHGSKAFPTPEQIMAAGFDGVLLLGIVDRKILGAFAQSKVPCVLLDHWPGDIPLNCVVVDNFTGAYLLTKALLHQGHREVCFIRYVRAVTTGSDQTLLEPDVAEREDACRLALKEEGVLLRASHLLDATGSFGDPVKQIDAILALQPRPTAIFSLGQDEAGALIAELKKRGHEVPRDFSIVCFGAKGDPDPYGVTAAMADFGKMGEVGVGRLRQIMGGAPQSRLRINVPVQIQDGKTVGPLKKAF